MSKKIKIIFIIFIFILLTNICFATYKTVIKGNVVSEMKIPIFIVQESNIQSNQMNSTDKKIYENTFNILNYIDEQNIISEIEFEYYIKIIPSTNNFPIKYKLIKLDTNEELNLDNNLESPKLKFSTSKESHNYKLVVEWDMDNNTQNLDESLNVEIQIKGVQSI